MPILTLKFLIFLRKGFVSRSNRKGFALVESLVAIAILGVSAATFISNLSTGSLAVKTLDEEVTSQHLLQTQMEVIKAAPYDTGGTSYTRIAAPSGYSLSVTVNSLVNTDTHIQKITLNAYHNGNLSGTLENFKVDR